MTQNSNIGEIEQLYQRIMSELESDLMLENLAGISQKYNAESADDRVKRKERYATALTECFTRIDAVIKQMKQDSHAFKTHVMDLYYNKEAAASVATLHSLEDSINQS